MNDAALCALSEAAPFGPWECSSQGEVLYLSAAFLELLGLTEEESRNLGWMHRLSDRDRPVAQESWSRSLATGDPWECAFTVTAPDGTRRRVHSRGCPIRDSDGAILGWAGMHLDVTAQLKAQEFEKQLIGIVGHDLRNPLAAILTGATALIRRPADERQLRILSRMISSTERASRLLTYLVDFTHARVGGGIPLRPSALDLHQLAGQVVENARKDHPERAIILISDGPGQGEWDKERLTQALSHLLANALQHSPVDSVIEFETCAADHGMQIRIQNQGKPVPEEIFPQLFEAFRRGPGDAPLRSRNVGLGLFLVRHIVEGHGGTVKAQSSAEGETTITLLLPRHAKARP